MADVDIVIPVYNEDREIVETLSALQRCVTVPFCILICYDHDDDRTLPVVEAYRQRTGLEVRFIKNTGAGAHGAVVSGFRASTSPAVITLPADDSFNADRIDRMVEVMRTGCDVVCASRFAEGGTMEGCRWLKAVIVRATAFTLYHVARVPTRDATNGFRLFSRRLLNTVAIESTTGFTYSLELLVKCHRLGWRIGEVPALWFERKTNESRFRVLGWAFAYLRWYWYAYATTYLRRGADTVPLLERS